jgi:hypothetical protein
MTNCTCAYSEQKNLIDQFRVSLMLYSHLVFEELSLERKREFLTEMSNPPLHYTSEASSSVVS